jgi:hypothetical protein
MKKLILIALALTLAMGIAWAPSVTAAGPYPITIHKTIPPGGPEEDFTFHAWRDFNNNFWLNGVVDDDDVYLGSVIIHGAGTGTIDSPVLGSCIVCEELIPGSVYEPQPCQPAQSGCVPVTFENELGELCELIIYKVDESGKSLAGACFNITPDPRTGTGFLELCDNDANDECPADGVLCLSGLICGLTITVEETVAPPDYIPAPDQTVTISATVTLTFVNPMEERGQLKIKKVGECGRLLGGAEFLIEPNPKTGTGSLTVVDNGLNDEDPTAGILLVTNCLKGITYTVTEKVAPPGYVPGPPQTVTIACEQYLKFVNTKKQCGCGWWGGWWYWRGWCWGSCWGWR